MSLGNSSHGKNSTSSNALEHNEEASIGQDDGSQQAESVRRDKLSSSMAPTAKVEAKDSEGKLRRAEGSDSTDTNIKNIITFVRILQNF